MIHERLESPKKDLPDRLKRELQKRRDDLSLGHALPRERNVPRGKVDRSGPQGRCPRKLVKYPVKGFSSPKEA